MHYPALQPSHIFRKEDLARAASASGSTSMSRSAAHSELLPAPAAQAAAPQTEVQTLGLGLRASSSYDTRRDNLGPYHNYRPLETLETSKLQTLVQVWHGMAALGGLGSPAEKDHASLH